MSPLIERLGARHEDIAEFCRRWNVARFEVFGSVLREDFTPQSDVDVMVTFEPGGKPGIHGLLQMERDLGAMFGREVDMVERKLVEANPNWMRRKSILESAQLLYAA